MSNRTELTTRHRVVGCILSLVGVIVVLEAVTFGVIAAFGTAAGWAVSFLGIPAGLFVTNWWIRR